MYVVVLVYTRSTILCFWQNEKNATSMYFFFLSLVFPIDPIQWISKIELVELRLERDRRGKNNTE